MILNSLRVEVFGEPDALRHPECSCEGPPVYGGLQALLRRMHPRTPAWHDGTLIEDEGFVVSHHPDQGGAWGTHATTNACSYGFHLTPRR